MSLSEGLKYSRRLIFRTCILAGAVLTGIVWMNLQAQIPAADLDFNIATVQPGSMVCLEFDWDPAGNYFPAGYFADCTSLFNRAVTIPSRMTSPTMIRKNHSSPPTRMARPLKVSPHTA